MLRKCLALAAIACALFAPSARAQNCAPFTDVLASSSFCGNIQWLFNRGVTLGCTATQYCPANFVRRDQMAAFLNRLADNLFPLTCAAGQVMKWNGTAWTCAADNPGVTSITAGTGLTGGTITTAGTVAADTTYLQRRVSTSCAPGSSIRAIAADGNVTCEADDGVANAFVHGGNAFGMTAVLGTTDNQPLDIRVNGSRVMRYEPATIGPNVIGGSPTNSVTPGVSSATIGGGRLNHAGNNESTIGGGNLNTANGALSTIGGGDNNDALGIGSTVSGGLSNDATGTASTVAGGGNNQAIGSNSIVVGGSTNVASGTASFAAGRFARASGTDCVVFSLWGSGPGMGCNGSQFNIGSLHGLSVDYHSQRADGGGDRFVYIGNNFPPFTITTWSGATLGDNGVWNSVSDADKKHAFAELDKRALLEKLAALPIRSWSYKVETEDIRHIGPTSQDFMAAFGLGHDDKTIGTIDADGVALAAIQELHQLVLDKDRRIATLERALDELGRRVDALLARR